MYVLYIGGFNLPDKNAAAQRVIANAKMLREIGYEVVLVGLDKTEDHFWYEGLECINLKYPQTVFEWILYLLQAKNYVPFIEQYSPEIIIAYNHPAVALDRIRQYGVMRGIRIVSDCTEWYTPEGNIVQRIIKGWDTRKRMEEIHLKMDGILSISRFLHEYYSSRGVKSLLLPPLVDSDDYKWKCVPRPRGKDEIVLTYAGSPGHKDCLDRLVKTISELSASYRIRFDVIGINEQQFINAYKYTEDIALANICFYGRLSHEETLNKLTDADFQIFIRNNSITTKAGFPTKFVESITAGVPVLTNLTSNIGDYLQQGKNGFPIDASTDESLKSSLARVFSLPKEELLKVRKEINRDLFDYRCYIPKMKEFLEQL